MRARRLVAGWLGWRRRPDSVRLALAYLEERERLRRLAVGFGVESYF